MTKTQFRILVALSFCVGLLGGLIDLVIPQLVSNAFRQAQEALDENLSIYRLVLSAVISIPGFLLILISTYGLYRFRYWAPRIGLVGTAITLLAWPTLGSWVQSGIAVSLSFAASYAWGGALLISFVPPYKSWFSKPIALAQSEA